MRRQGWTLEQVRFYTGVPNAADNAFWNYFWVAKLGTMGHQGVHVFSRPLRYRNKTVRLPGGHVHTFLVGEEKGIDVRIAIDVIRLAARNQYDVGVIFSQDQDLSEAADEVRLIAREQGRWIKLASAFPFSPTTRNTAASTRPIGCGSTGRHMTCAWTRVTIGREEGRE